jgi:hypothetical protein
MERLIQQVRSWAKSTEIEQEATHRLRVQDIMSLTSYTCKLRSQLEKVEAKLADAEERAARYKKEIARLLSGGEKYPWKPLQ